MKAKILFFTLGLAQMLLGLDVLKRLLLTARGERLQPALPACDEAQPALSVIIPTLNEYTRLAPCLEGLLAQVQNIDEILVVDGGSRDGTQKLVQSYSECNSRVHLLDASPIPAGWNGKAWGLHCGLQQAASATRWLLTVDADVRPDPLLVSSLLAKAQKTKLAALSIATLQEIASPGVGLLHPSLLTTLIYRFGSPGRAIHKVSEVQANGQCFLLQREVLEECGGFLNTRDSLCEDVTLARALVASGHAVGFYEAGKLVSTCMYKNGRETWQNWTRSLPMRDRFSQGKTLVGWLEVTLIQALPLPLWAVLLVSRIPARWLLLLNGFLALMRLGILVGTTRAYRHLTWSYWLSPLCDLPVAGKLASSAIRRRHLWRGRSIVRGGVK